MERAAPHPPRCARRPLRPLGASGPARPTPAPAASPRPRPLRSAARGEVVSGQGSHYPRWRRPASPAVAIAREGLGTLPVPPPGRWPGSFRRETGSPLPASLRSATSPPVGRFGTCTPYPCPRGFAAPSPASLRCAGRGGFRSGLPLPALAEAGFAGRSHSAGGVGNPPRVPINVVRSGRLELPQP